MKVLANPHTWQLEEEEEKKNNEKVEKNIEEGMKKASKHGLGVTAKYQHLATKNTCLWQAEKKTLLPVYGKL